MERSIEGGETRPNLPRLWNIQYLRGVAAIGVVAYHAALTSGTSFGFGARGIHVFFVISGFLMFAITNSESRPWPFLRDRIIRVVPLYWLATIAALLLGLIHQANPPGFANVLCSLLFIPCGAPGAGAHFFPLLAPGWTLNYEMLFYAVFAAMLFLPRRAQVPATVFVFILLWTLRRLTGPANPPLGFWGDPIIFEFAAGLALGAVWRSRYRRGALGALLVAFAALRVWAWWAQLGESLGPLCMAGGVVSVALLLERGGRRPWPLPLMLGDASYSIYLWHVIALRLLAIGPRFFHLPPALWFATNLVGAVAAGVAAHYILERPLLKFVKAARWRQNAPVPGGV